MKKYLGLSVLLLQFCTLGGEIVFKKELADKGVIKVEKTTLERKRESLPKETSKKEKELPVEAETLVVPPGISIVDTYLLTVEKSKETTVIWTLEMWAAKEEEFQVEPGAEEVKIFDVAEISGIFYIFYYAHARVAVDIFDPSNPKFSQSIIVQGRAVQTFRSKNFIQAQVLPTSDGFICWFEMKDEEHEMIVAAKRDDKYIYDTLIKDIKGFWKSAGPSHVSPKINLIKYSK